MASSRQMQAIDPAEKMKIAKMKSESKDESLK